MKNQVFNNYVITLNRRNLVLRKENEIFDNRLKDRELLLYEDLIILKKD